ncbi:MAG: thioredoxin domain-containing protein [Chloroflexota bacterium]
MTTENNVPESVPQAPDEADSTVGTVNPAETTLNATEAVEQIQSPADTTPTVEYEPTTSPASAPVEDDMIVIPRSVVNYVLVAVVFFALGGVMGRFAFPAQTSIETAEIEGVVRDAVAEVFESAGINTARGPEDGERYEVAFDEDDPFLGNPDGDIVIVEFSDFLCGFCGRFANDTLPLLIDEYGDRVRFVYRDFPVINPSASPVIALAAECAQDQGMFWEYHDTLFASTGQIAGPESLFSFADDLGMDVEQFQACFEDGTHMAEIEADSAYARELGLRGTPGFFVNGRFVNGAVPIETFREVIDAEIERLNS